MLVKRIPYPYLSIGRAKRRKRDMMCLQLFMNPHSVLNPKLRTVDPVNAPQLYHPDILLRQSLQLLI